MTFRPAGPWRRLTRHFFASLFDLGILTDLAAESFKRLVIGICAAFLSVGLLMARLFMIKYANLSGLASADQYRAAVLADHALLIALPMWVIAMVTTLVGHALFPDEIDFRVLKSLPLTERTIFTAKLSALGLFVALFVAGTHAAIAPVFLITSMGRWAEGSWLARAAAFEFASLLASGFAVLNVAAVHGAIVGLAPRGRVFAIAATSRSAIVCALVLVLPLLARLPAQAAAFSQGDAWLSLVPPAWFVGVERTVLGRATPAFVSLAAIGVVTLGLVALVTLVAYVALYRRLDLVIVRTSSLPRSSRKNSILRDLRVLRGGELFHAALATRRFAIITLRRSIPHQGAVVALSSIAVGLALNSLLNANVTTWLVGGSGVTARLQAAAVWMPFVLIFVMSLAVRTALALPAELRANWVFRMTEQPATRLAQLEASAQLLRFLAVILPVLIVFPLQVALLEASAAIATVTALALGWLLSEILLRNWNRLPFTCSLVLGKTFVPQLVLTGLLSFMFFTQTGTTLVWIASRSRTVWGMGIALIAGVAVALRWRRRRQAVQLPLVFEDELPTEINPLRLS